MKNLITYLLTINVEDKVNMRLDMIARDCSPRHMHMINYFTKYRDEIFQDAIIKSDAKTSSIEKIDNFALKFIPRHERVQQGDQGYAGRGKDISK